MKEATYSAEELVPVMIKTVAELKPKAAIELVSFDGTILPW